MSEYTRGGELQSAYEDLLHRTLVSVPCDLARLIYLASTRDYNTGTYAEAREALKTAHREVFSKLAELRLEQLVDELELYVRVSREHPTGLLRTWQQLEPYRVAVPMEADPALVRLFLSNIRLALEVLKHRRLQRQDLPSDASPLLSLGR